MMRVLEKTKLTARNVGNVEQKCKQRDSGCLKGVDDDAGKAGFAIRSRMEGLIGDTAADAAFPNRSLRHAGVDKLYCDSQDKNKYSQTEGAQVQFSFR